MVTGLRRLVACLRRSYLCKCGCKGWCTLWPVFNFVAWSMEAAATGRYPERRWDGAEWSASDGERSWLAGSALRCSSFLLFCKGDWAEYARTFGFAS
eukprot:8031333-Alexandrium_andersonii.AAC.1